MIERTVGQFWTWVLDRRAVRETTCVHCTGPLGAAPVVSGLDRYCSEACATEAWESRPW